MGRLAWWEDRWTHKHREDKQQPDCIPQDISMQCSGKTLCQGSLWYLAPQSWCFKYQAPRPSLTSQHPSVLWGADPRAPWSLQYLGLSPSYWPADLSWPLLMGHACMLPAHRAHSHRKQLETGFRQDEVKVIWHRVLPNKCSDLLLVALLTSFIPCLILSPFSCTCTLLSSLVTHFHSLGLSP